MFVANKAITSFSDKFLFRRSVDVIATFRSAIRFTIAVLP